MNICKNHRMELLKYLIVKTAPVTMKVKCSVLLRLTDCAYVSNKRHHDSFCLYQQQILKYLNLNCCVMTKRDSSCVVMFYDEKMLNGRLSNTLIISFLNNHGYSRCKNMIDYLEVLKRRFAGNDFPHEIGVFLDYPLKDVMGFINKETPSYQGLWKVFGNPLESISRMQAFKKAEKMASTLMLEIQDIANFETKYKNLLTIQNV